MSSHRTRFPIAKVASWVVALHLGFQRAGAEPEFIDLGVLSNGGGAAVAAVNDDGRAAAGSGAAGPSQIAFRWADGNVTELGVLSGGTTSISTGINGSGSVVVGNSRGTTNRAFRWTSNASGGVMTELAFLLGGSGAGAAAVSRDGLTVAGTAGYAGAIMGRGHAVRWFVGGTGVTVQDLGALPGGLSSFARGMSRDGSVVVGASNTSANGAQRAFRWRASTASMQNLGAFPGSIESESIAVTANGNVVIGFCTQNTIGLQTTRAFKWVQTGPTTGVMQPLPLLNGDDFNEAYSISDDGSRIVGMAITSGGPFAVLWTSAGVIALNDYLEGLGVDLGGWRLSSASTISADGKTIAGIGGFNGQPRGWLVRNLPSHCHADFNGAGGVTVQDIFDFLVAYFANDTRADVNLSGGVTLQDIFDYLVHYFSGCP